MNETVPEVAISREWPYVIEWVNQRFVGLFGCEADRLLGRPISVVHGLPTDIGRWNYFLGSAASTLREVRDQFQIHGSSCGQCLSTVVCKPIVDAMNKPTGSLVVSFATEIEAGQYSMPLLVAYHRDVDQNALPASKDTQTETASENILQQTAKHQGFAQTDQDFFHSVHALAETSAQMSLGSSNAHNRPTSSGPTIFPRRRGHKLHSETRSSRPPVVVTLDLLRDLSDLSLIAASELLGISPTALKRACRKVGMRRWMVFDEAGGAASAAAVVEGGGAEEDRGPDPDGGAPHAAGGDPGAPGVPSHNRPSHNRPRLGGSHAAGEPSKDRGAASSTSPRPPSSSSSYSSSSWSSSPSPFSFAASVDAESSHAGGPSGRPSTRDPGPAGGAAPDRGEREPAAGHSLQHFGEGLWLEVPDLDLPELS
jgi:hypothetical protein